MTKLNKIGIIGTSATVSSNVYEKEIKKLLPDVKVISKSCPLFVPLAEKGLFNDKATKLICQNYLGSFNKNNMDVLILGCTHYPLLSNSIKKVVGENIQLIDSAKPTAKKLKEILEEKRLLNNQKSKGCLEVYVTDAPERVQIIAEQFLGDPLPGGLKKVALVNL